MLFYSILRKYNDINLNSTEEELFEWKINNLSTYIDNLSYINDNEIHFSFGIYDTDYNLILKYNNNFWIIDYSDFLDHNDKVHMQILNMIDYINNKVPLTLTDILDISEKAIDDFEFGSDTDSSSESDSDTSESNNPSYSDLDDADLSAFIVKKNFDELNESKNEEPQNEESDNEESQNEESDNEESQNEESDNESPDYINFNSDSDFDDFIEFINNKDKENEHLIVKASSFGYEENITLIIDQINSIKLLDGIKLEIIDDNIYNFNVYTEKILINIVISPSRYLKEPPMFYIIKPNIILDLTYIINSMDCFQLYEWIPNFSIAEIIIKIIEYISKDNKDRIMANCIKPVLCPYDNFQRYLSEFFVINNYIDIIYYTDCIGSDCMTDNLWCYIKSIEIKIPSFTIPKKHSINIDREIENLKNLLDNFKNVKIVTIYLDTLTQILLHKFKNMTILLYYEHQTYYDLLVQFTFILIENTEIFSKEQYINTLKSNTLYSLKNIILYSCDDKVSELKPTIKLFDKIISSYWNNYEFIKKLDSNINSDSDSDSDNDNNSESRSIAERVKINDKMKSMRCIVPTSINFYNDINILNTFNILLNNQHHNWFVFVDTDYNDRIKVMIISKNEPKNPFNYGCFFFDITVYNGIYVQMMLGDNNVKFIDLPIYEEEAPSLYRHNNHIEYDKILSSGSIIDIVSYIESKLYSNESDEYNIFINYNNLLWGMIDVLENSKFDYFRDIIRYHFIVNQDNILKSVNSWIEIAKSLHQDIKKYNEKFEYLKELIVKL